MCTIYHEFFHKRRPICITYLFLCHRKKGSWHQIWFCHHCGEAERNYIKPTFLHVVAKIISFHRETQMHFRSDTLDGGTVTFRFARNSTKRISVNALNHGFQQNKSFTVTYNPHNAWHDAGFTGARFCTGLNWFRHRCCHVAWRNG